MIKLGVFDLDGTLLNSEGRLPETFYDDVEWLRRRGVSVAIASARPVQFLFEMFDRDVDLLISGEDGNLFFRGKQLLHARYVSSELVAKVYEITAGRDDVAVICTGPDDFCVSEEHYRRFVEWGLRRFLPDEPKELTGNGKFCKIHVFCRDGIEAANMTAPVSLQGVQTYKNLYEYVTEGKIPEPKFQNLPVIPVSGDDLGAWIDWADYEGAYNYVYGE